jgi:hypothetical protein
VTHEQADLYRRVERQLPRLARAMVDRFVEEIPLYGLLPREQLEGEILDVTDHNLRLFFTMIRDGRGLDEVELQHVLDSAARRAEERVPLDAVLAAYHLGCRVGWEALVAEAKPAEAPVLVEAAGAVLAYVRQVTAAVAAAYLDEQQSIFGEERDARRSLVNALLTGAPAEGYAARVGVTLAPAWVVVELRIDEHIDETDRRVGGAVAARRKLARLVGALEAWAGEPVLSRLDPGGGQVLLPAAPDDPSWMGARLAGLVDDLAKAAGAAVTAAWAAADATATLPAAALQARDVLHLVRDLGHPPGAYALSDVLLEYQLSRPSDAQGVLARLLDPIDRNPDLQRTLECYLQCNLDRRETAAGLHVHPNTLDYRLRRIVELTGLDPATSRGLQLLGAALAARRFGR